MAISIYRWYYVQAPENLNHFYSLYFGIYIHIDLCIQIYSGSKFSGNIAKSHVPCNENSISRFCKFNRFLTCIIFHTILSQTYVYTAQRRNTLKIVLSLLDDTKRTALSVRNRIYITLYSHKKDVLYILLKKKKEGIPPKQ